MGRYKFQWVNTGPDVLAALGVALGVDGDVVEALVARYGARPKDAFIADMWPGLLDIWLSRDHDSLHRLADTIAARNVGDQSIDRSTPGGQSEFLRSCRNTSGLRSDVLAAWIERGEQGAAETARQVQPRQTARSEPELAETFDAGAVSLTDWLLSQLETGFGDALEVDDDGDIPIVAGSSVTYLRPIDDDLPRVEIFSILVTGVEPSESLAEVVAALNESLIVGKAVLVEDTLQLQHTLLVTGLGAEQLVATVKLVAASADRLDDLLAEKLGGSTFLQVDSDEDAAAVDGPDSVPPEGPTTLRSGDLGPVSLIRQGSDVGLAVIDQLRELLMIDDEWLMTFDRGFSWWGFRLAQHVIVDLPQSDGRMDFATVRISTEVVREVTNADQAVQWVNVANAQQTLSALVWDAERRTIRECCTAVITEENVGWLVPILSTAAVMQNSAAHSRAHGLAPAVGGIPAESTHPLNGRRSELDNILLAPEQVIAVSGRESSAFHGGLVEVLESFVQQMGLLGFSDDSGFSCEVPYTGSTTAMEASALGGAMVPNTALVRIDADVAHPQYGNGALVTLRLPTSMPYKQTAEWACWLNQVEATSMTDTTLLGAWCPDPTGGDNGPLAFVAFVPNVLARPGLLQNLVLYQAVRAKLAATYLPPRSSGQ